MAVLSNLMSDGIANEGRLDGARALVAGRGVSSDVAPGQPYRAILEHVNAAVFVTDAAGTVLDANLAAEELFGCPRAALLGRSLLACAAPSEPGSAESEAWTANLGERAVFHGATLVRADGERVVCDISTSAVETGGERLCVTVAHDASDNARVQAELRERISVAALVSDVNVAIRANLSVAACLQPCADAIIRHLGAAIVRIWTLDRGGETLDIQATAGLTSPSEGGHARIRVGHCDIGRIAELRTRYVTNELAHDLLVTDRAWAVEQGLTAFAGLPLTIGDRLIGVLAVLSASPLTERAISGLASVTDALAVGLERNRVEREHHELQEQLLRAQKLHALGELAGGIAHDFNNLLAVITSYAELVASELDPGDAHRDDLREISAAAERAATLTRQLLAFGRRQVLQPAVVDVYDIVTDMKRMLARVLPESIDLVTTTEPRLGHVCADRGQIEQVVMNLVVNARDAMPDGGRLTISTANARLDADAADMRAAIKPGPYVVLSVSDTGCGITPEVRARIFEPFFTTKAPGRGTGLGLASVFGIVQQSDGNVFVYSEPGLGTTFKIYLPCVAELRTDAAIERGGGPLSKGNETVLLVEDNETVRAIAKRILRRSGYTVIAAATPDEALRRCADPSVRFDVLLTDVVMPRMSGPDLVTALSARRGPIRVVYMSGYAGSLLPPGLAIEPGLLLVEKPFTPESLTRRIREALETRARPPV